MPERRVSRPLEAERERQLIRWALAEGYAVTVREGSEYLILIEQSLSSEAVPAQQPAPYDQDAGS